MRTRSIKAFDLTPLLLLLSLPQTLVKAAPTEKIINSAQGKGTVGFLAKTTIGSEFNGASSEASIILQVKVNTPHNEVFSLSGSVSLPSSSLSTAMKIRDEHMCQKEFLDCAGTGKIIQGLLTKQNLILDSHKIALETQSLWVDFKLKEKTSRSLLILSGPFQTLCTSASTPAPSTQTNSAYPPLAFKMSGELDFTSLGVAIPTAEIISVLLDLSVEKVLKIEGNFILNLDPQL